MLELILAGADVWPDSNMSDMWVYGGGSGQGSGYRAHDIPLQRGCDGLGEGYGYGYGPGPGVGSGHVHISGGHGFGSAAGSGYGYGYGSKNCLGSDATTPEKDIRCWK